MRFHWLLSGFIGAFLLCCPARAGKILSWEFESGDNNLLVFQTDEGVQPEAELLNNPTRLVIDLPGTTLGRETVKESYSGRIRELRIGQPESDISRIVVELAPGYTLDGDEVEFESISPSHWSVEIPEPEVAPLASADDEEERETLELPQVELPSKLPGFEEADVPAIDNAPGVFDSPEVDNAPVVDNAPAVVDSPHIKATKNGFYIGIDGDRQIVIDSERDGDRINFFLEGITLPPDLDSQTVAVEQYGVSSIEFEQTDDERAVMSLAVTENSPGWLATFSRIRGLLLVPKGKLPESDLATDTTDTLPEIPAAASTEIDSDTNFSSISKIELIDDSELSIHADRDLSAIVSRLSNGIYQVTIDKAELAEDFQGPQLQAGSPVSELRVRQEDSRVILEITTRLRYRLGNLDPDGSQIALPIEEGLAPLPEGDAPLLPPGFAKAPKDSIFEREIPSVPASDRPRIIIDPGHGGEDPGTIGIGGVQEKDVILPISLDVAEILRKQDIEVIMTRDTDNFISLQGRTDMANDLDADLFVSIHANAINLSRPDVNGLETYYYQSGRRLAEIIHWSILNGVEIDNRGIRRARFYVLRHSAMPAVLIEIGFLTGATDSARLKDPDHRRRMAEAIANGIVQYIKQNNL